MLVFVAAVLAIFNTETAGAFGAAFTAAGGFHLIGVAVSVTGADLLGPLSAKTAT
jgi:hypothetical protein